MNKNVIIGVSVAVVATVLFLVFQGGGEVDICKCLTEPGNTEWSKENKIACRDAISERCGVENWEEVSNSPAVEKAFDEMSKECGLK